MRKMEEPGWRATLELVVVGVAGVVIWLLAIVGAASLWGWL